MKTSASFWSQAARAPVDVVAHVLLLAGGLGVEVDQDRVGAGGDQVLEDGFRDAEAAGGVLAVDGDEVELVAGAQLGQLLDDGVAAGAAYHIAEEQQTHPASFHT